MDIILIGSGNTATILGRKSLDAGHRVIQVYSRLDHHAALLAKELGSAYTSSISSIEIKADLMVVALRDMAVRPFITSLGKINILIAHTAGSLPLDEVKNASAHYGVLYPLQSLRKEITVLPPLTILVDANGPESRDALKEFAATIASTVIEADDDTRFKYHLAATLVNNFTNYLFTEAAAFCKKENISFSLLQPLMEETVIRLRNMTPAAAQTGPAIRNDQLTLEKHRQLLKSYPAILKFYNLFTDEIQKAGLRL